MQLFKLKRGKKRKKEIRFLLEKEISLKKKIYEGRNAEL